VRATTRSGLTANAATVGAHTKRSNAGLFVGLSVALSLLVGGGVLGYRALASVRGASSGALSAHEPLPPSPVSPEPHAVPVPAAPVRKRFALAIVPAEAEVSIDGEKARVNAGQVDVEGVVGATRNVRLSFKGQQQDFVVAIAESGVVPPKLDFALKTPPLAPARPAPARAAAPAKPPVAPPPAAKPEARSAPRQDTGLNRNVDEFGN
jgi:hypothetical protein